MNLLKSVSGCSDVCKKVLSDFIEKKQKQGIQYALFFALNFSLLFNPIDSKNVSVKQFTRTFGLGTMRNWDVSRVISNFYVWIALFTILFFSFWIFFDWWKNRSCNAEERNAIAFLDDVMVIGAVQLGLKCFSFFLGRRWIFVSFSAFIIDFYVALTFLYLIFHCSKSLSFDFYLRIIFSLFAFSFCVFVIFRRTSLKFCFIVLAFLGIATTFFAKFAKNIEGNKLIFSFAKSCSVTFCFFPIMTSLYFELLNVLNSHNVFITRIRRYYAVAVFLIMCLTVVLAVIIYRKNLNMNFWKKLFYPMMVLGLASLSVQPALSSTVSANIFESANLSILVSDFLSFGKLPIVNHYGGHMMTGVWQAFLYAFLNGDKFGAIFSPYSLWLEFSVIALLFFYFVKIINNEHLAFFSVLVFPFAATSCWNYFALGMLLVLAVIFYIKKQTLSRAFLIWGTFAWCTLYRLDLGFAFFAATLFSLFIWILQTKNKTALKQVLLSFFISVFIGISLWCVFCLQQKVNPVLRLLEFLKLSASNPTWAYNHIGNTGTNFFAIAYLMVPFAMSLLLVIFVFSKRVRNVISKEQWILLVIFGFSYFFNFPRGLVRHSLAENNINIVLWCASVFLSAALSILIQKRKFFLPLLSVLVILSIQFVNGSSFSFLPVAENILPKMQRSLTEERSSKKQRVVFNNRMKDWCDSYKFVADILLEDDESFLDFMNRTFVYSAIDRECPVYVAQSPLMLSGEFTQKMFIKEISEKIEKVPIAFLPLDDTWCSASLDSIMNSYRYYKVSEFIFSHYKPLCKFGDFAVWALNERYEDLKQKLPPKQDEDDVINFLVEGTDFSSNNNCEIIKDFENKTVILRHTGTDPFVSNMHDFIDVSKYQGRRVALSFVYETDETGLMELFYTTEKNEPYSEEQKFVHKSIVGRGKADFAFPVTEFTRFRLDISEKSSVKITSVLIREDTPIPIDEHHCSDFHSYDIYYLPLLWAEKDAKYALRNKILANLDFDGRFFRFNSSEFNKSKGNYLRLKIKNPSESDNTVRLHLGIFEENEFKSSVQFSFIVEKGEHDYIVRLSSDYLWYLENLNALKIDGDFEISEVQILEGD